MCISIRTLPHSRFDRDRKKKSRAGQIIQVRLLLTWKIGSATEMNFCRFSFHVLMFLLIYKFVLPNLLKTNRYSAFREKIWDRASEENHVKLRSYPFYFGPGFERSSIFKRSRWILNFSESLSKVRNLLKNVVRTYFCCRCRLKIIKLKLSASYLCTSAFI